MPFVRHVSGSLVEFFNMFKLKPDPKENQNSPKASPEIYQEGQKVGFMDLPVEMRTKIIKYLPNKDALRLRETSHRLNNEVTASCSFKLTIYGENVNDELRDFISRINVLSIRFKRLAKAAPSKFDDEIISKDPDYIDNEQWPNIKYIGPNVYITVSKVQILTLTSPIWPNGKRYDYGLLRNFLLNFTGDIFLSIIL